MSIIETVTDQCRRCYSCVRQCPSRAIRVQAGQAHVIKERCVACGRCLKACSRGARRVVDSLPPVRALIDGGAAVAMLAPSFPAAFPQWKPGQVIAALRHAGFAAVTEVAFGADLVTREYARGFAADPDRLVITSACPASVAYIRKYAVNVVPYIAPILSPMAAMGKALKLRLRPGCRPVFIGPCTAKLEEILDPEVTPWVDGAMTFQDMNALFAACGIDPGTLPEEDFDGPPSNAGGAYPIPLGLVHAAGIPSDPIEDRVHFILTVESYIDIVHDLDRRIAEGRMDHLGARFFDVLYCRGCIAGPLLDSTESFLRRKERITAFYRAHHTPEKRARAQLALDELADLDMSRSFTADPQVTPMPTEEEIRQILARTGKLRPEDEAQLSHLRLPLLSRQGDSGPPGARRGGHVPAVPHRTSRGHGPQGESVEPAAHTGS